MATMLMFLLLITQFSITTARQNDSLISLGSSLSPDTNKSYWLSNSGQFAFGFYQQGDGFAVGIWFEKMEEKTVVWTAKRDDPPLPQDTTLLLSGDGRLFLQDEQGRQEHISNASQLAASASMLDSGNFVLYNSNSTIIWQSFDSPTDTLLPGQRLVPQEGRDQLVSSISETNHSNGRFQLLMQSYGNLLLFPILSSGLAPSRAYWSTRTYSGDGVTLNLDSNGQLYLLNSTEFIKKNISDTGRSHLGMKVVYRVTIDVDGILRLYSHNWIQNNSWVVEWVSTNNRCDPIGLCGLNSYCGLIGQEPHCFCLSGFDFIDQQQKSLGCKRNSSTKECKAPNEEAISLQELSGVSWEASSYSVVSSDNENACKEECLRDCNCEVALFQDQQCSKQRLPLRFGRSTQGIGSHTTIIKVWNGSFEGTNQTTIVSRNVIKQGRRLDVLIFGVTCMTFALIVLLFSVFLVCRRRLQSYKKVPCEFNEETSMVEDVLAPRSFTFRELETATNGFTERLGRGAFSTVFKGTLPYGSRSVAVKRLEKVVAEGEVEFRNEMRSISRTHHRNLLRLLGYCHEGSNWLLVYDYMSNGSLANFLFKSEMKRNWDERIRIAFGIAKGILYLHEECESPIIHCDISPNNILIDENHSAKIADFGLAKLLKPDQTRTTTRIRGTRGFVAPEWHKNQPITAKADVYSFGIVLLVIICHRKSVDMSVPDREAILAEWVYECFKANDVRRLVGDEQVEEEALERMVRIGLWCIQEESQVRPAMKKVVAMFEGTLDIPIPPTLTLYSNSSASSSHLRSC
ncbi:hypothetical protein TIFTF001_046377 [Ficus carica]|uniref:Receptor-like serine/threonine-protein kinase n=1 Tax=Ficus carica TaxID=3494 RepID=A0AA87ZUY9_FICCA|nr:hypothetical protein TIFTF001_046375 [Ficus carica]GMN29799.1 hypothetical protein TIFTF001_046377 [Ficus carica]